MEERYFCNTPSALHAALPRAGGGSRRPVRRPRGAPHIAGAPRSPARRRRPSPAIFASCRSGGRAGTRRVRPRGSAPSPAAPPRGRPPEQRGSRKSRHGPAAPAEPAPPRAPGSAQAVRATRPGHRARAGSAWLGSGCDENGVRRGHGPAHPHACAHAGHGPDALRERHWGCTEGTASPGRAPQPDPPGKSGNCRSPGGGRSHRAGRPSPALPSRGSPSSISAWAQEPRAHGLKSRRPVLPPQAR